MADKRKSDQFSAGFFKKARTSAGQGNRIEMESLPEVVLLKIAKYLTPAECVRLSSTCKKFHGVLPQYVCFLGEDLNIIGAPYRDWKDYEIYFDSPELRGKVKSFTASVEWKDQGQGWMKSQLMAKLMRHDSGENKPIAEKRNMFGYAKHHWANSTCILVSSDPVVKLAKPGDFYRFEGHAGDGGEHSLHVRKFSVLLELFSNKSVN